MGSRGSGILLILTHNAARESFTSKLESGVFIYVVRAAAQYYSETLSAPSLPYQKLNVCGANRTSNPMIQRKYYIYICPSPSIVSINTIYVNSFHFCHPFHQSPVLTPHVPIDLWYSFYLSNRDPARRRGCVAKEVEGFL